MDCLFAQGDFASLLTLLHVKVKKSGRSLQQEPTVIELRPIMAMLAQPELLCLQTGVGALLMHMCVAKCNKLLASICFPSMSKYICFRPAVV